MICLWYVCDYQFAFMLNWMCLIGCFDSVIFIRNYEFSSCFGTVTFQNNFIMAIFKWLSYALNIFIKEIWYIQCNTIPYNPSTHYIFWCYWFASVCSKSYCFGHRIYCHRVLNNRTCLLVGPLVSQSTDLFFIIFLHWAIVP